MKTPKLLFAVPILALSASAIIGWSAVTGAEMQPVSARADAAADLRSKADVPMDQARITRMDAERTRISTRLGVASPMEVETVNGKDILAEAIDGDFIIAASLEEVESAMRKAESTADVKDDMEAINLMHRGSYRFFAPE